MSNSYQRVPSDGTMVLLDISIDYLDRDEITVYFDDVLTTAWIWSGTSDKRILFPTPVPNGVVVMVKRTTDASKLRHVFSAGAKFTAPNLDEDLKQALHMAQEASEANLVGDFFTNINMHGFRLYNVGTAVDDSDALTLAQYKADALGANAARVAAEAAAAAAASSASGVATLTSNLAASTGSSLIGWIAAGVGAVSRTVQAKLRDIAHVRDYGAVGDGVTDDALAIQRAMTAARTVVFDGELNYKVNSTLTTRDGQVLRLGKCTITANTGATPLFQTATAQDTLTVSSDGAMITGTCSVAFRLVGATNAPTVVSDYVRQVRINDLHITSSTIGIGVECVGAVRQVFISNCQVYAGSAFIATGKVVEVFIVNNMLFGATGAAGTRGIKYTSTGGTNKYSEGLHVVNNGIDGFERAVEIADMFVMTFVGNWVSAPTGPSMLFTGASTTTHSQKFTIEGNIIDKGLQLQARATVNAYDMKIAGNVFQAGGVFVGSNSAQFDIKDNRFRGGSGVAITINNTVNEFNVSGNDIDDSFSGAVSVLGTTGIRGRVSDNTFYGAGYSVYLERMVMLTGNDLGDGSSAGYVIASSNVVQGSKAVGSAIWSATVTANRGQRGYITMSFSYTGATALTQRFDLVPPTGMVIPSGSGWSAGFNYPYVASGHFSITVPFYCTQDVNGTLALNNAVGTAVTVEFHGWASVVKE